MAKLSKLRLGLAACLLLALFVVNTPLAAGAERFRMETEMGHSADQAKNEGKVVVWDRPGDRVRDAITQSFAKAFPDISLEFSGARGGELATKIKAERDAGIYSVDVLINGTSTADAYFKPMKALDPIEPALILPEVMIPKNWRDNRLEFSDRSTRLDLVFCTQNNVPLIFNPAQVKAEEVDELYKLLDPKWKGKIAVQDPIPSGTGNGVFRWLWHVLGPEKAKDFYRKSALKPVDRQGPKTADRVGRSRQVPSELWPRERSCTSSKSAASSSE